MKKNLMWAFSIFIIIVLNNPQWLEQINLSFIDVEAISVNLGWVWLGLIILKCIHMFFKYDREYVVENDNDNDENISYDVEQYLIEYLNRKYISSKSLACNIYNLISKGVFIPIVIDLKNNKHEYMFVLNKDFKMSTLSNEDLILKNFLISQVGNNDYWTFNSFEMIGYNNKQASYFNNIYNNWADVHNTLAVKHNIYERKDKSFFNIVLWISFIGFFLSFFILFNKFNYYIGFYLLAASLGFIFYSFTFTRLNITYVKIKLYYKILKQKMEYLNSNNKYEIKDANLWEKYLLYSPIMNKEKNVENMVKELAVEYDDDFDSQLFNLARTSFLQKLVKVTKTNFYLSNIASFWPVGLFSFLKITKKSNDVNSIFEEFEKNNSN